MGVIMANLLYCKKCNIFIVQLNEDEYEGVDRMYSTRKDYTNKQCFSIPQELGTVEYNPHFKGYRYNKSPEFADKLKKKEIYISDSFIYQLNQILQLLFQ